MNPDFTNTPLDHCQGFEEPCERTDAKWERNGAAYGYEKYNWSYLCPVHKEGSDEFWDQQWKEYWSDRF